MVWHIISFYFLSVSSFLLAVGSWFIVNEMKPVDFSRQWNGKYRKTWKGIVREVVFRRNSHRPLGLFAFTFAIWCLLFYVGYKML